jgi:hypothetical protein
MPCAEGAGTLGREPVMTCTRCGGLMVREQGWGRAIASDFCLGLTSFQIWRCLICGEAYDDEIARNRLRSRGSDTVPTLRPDIGDSNASPRTAGQASCTLSVSVAQRKGGSTVAAALPP